MNTEPTKTPPVPAKPTKEIPAWWRGGFVPLLVLILAAAIGDFYFPRISTLTNGTLLVGFGCAIGAMLLVVALLLLRRDFSVLEQVFLLLLGTSCSVAMAVSGSLMCWFMLPVSALVLLYTKAAHQEPEHEQAEVYNWWNYWLSLPHLRRFSGTRRILPLLGSIAIGIVCFLLFLILFASGNPVVEIVWNNIANTWNKVIDYLQPDWEIAAHAVMWLLGVLLFGFFTFRRLKESKASPWTAIPNTPPLPATSSSPLPHLPLMSLLGINLAFLITNAADINFLWFRRVPEGISQTEYLYDGAGSITIASLLAAGILLLLFRKQGSARRSTVSTILGYALVLQTILLAVSVYVRLFHQVADFGFTVRRIVAAECMLFGVLGLIILICYMLRANMLRCVSMAMASGVVLLGVMQINPPGSLAGDLNMHLGNIASPYDQTLHSSPNTWCFHPSDFYHHVPIESNLTFALHVYERTKATMQPDLKEHFFTRLRYQALNVRKRAQSDDWQRLNWITLRDLPAAEHILSLPYTQKPSGILKFQRRNKF